MSAFYSNSIEKFLSDDDSRIIGKLTEGISDFGFYQHKSSQTESWRDQITVLKRNLNGISGDIIFEYTIPRRGKRIDNILIIDGNIYVLEFKVGQNKILKQDIIQLEDYCLDLRDFHKESFNRKLVPILVATKAKVDNNNIINCNDNIIETQISCSDNLYYVLSCCKNFLAPSLKDISRKIWINSNYEPTPTIIETAKCLYSNQNVKEITRSHAGIENLTTTSQCVIDAINRAKAKNEKLICFITGVPGAGKTLAGLNIVHSKDNTDDLGIFLSGNAPLVKVLSEALAKDKSERENIVLKESRREVSTFIQNIHHFLKAYFENPGQVPVDHIVVFDEAQRAWDKKQSNRKFKREFSEPEIMLEIMDRHKDWAVIIALIGGGQEINTGEAGLSEWGRTLKEKFSHWKVLISPELKEGSFSTGGKYLFETIPDEIIVEENPSLHLQVSVRSYKAKKVAEFIECLLENIPKRSYEILDNDLNEYPIVFTRSIETAKNWLKKKQKGTRRIGMLASSGARRLKPYGLNVQNELDIVSWLLNSADDVRSSYYLEDPATEFAIQGLELDWTCVCWGGDFRYYNNDWYYKAFKGTKWQNVNKKETRQYILNKYRVLLTRAREGMVIWVPEGNIDDNTRYPEVYSGVADYLERCGIKEI